jgi:FkbM family methyltransferase
MNFFKSLRKFAERISGTHIYRTLPRGVDIFSDISVLLSKYKIRTLFDVGANVGQSARLYSKIFLASQILCFEPVTETFAQLQENTGKMSNVRCFHVALSSQNGRSAITAQGRSTMNHLLNTSELPAGGTAAPYEYVETVRLDDFCKAEGIDRISFLKIDTEGGDLNVLKGAEQMLTNQTIDLVEVEAGMNPHNRHHVPLPLLKEYMEQFSYYIFGVYEQCYEWPSGEPHLRRSNVVFISSRMIKEHSGISPHQGLIAG